MFSKKVEQLITILENQELDSPNGVVTSQLYSELFAAYLYINDLCSARFLWKRIPQNVKTGNTELEKIHKVYTYTCLWNNDIAGFFKAINYEWSSNIAELMFELREKIYKESIDLIGKSYTSLFDDQLCNMLNQTLDVITELCNSLGWEIQDGSPRLILPKKNASGKSRYRIIRTSARQLNRFCIVFGKLKSFLTLFTSTHPQRRSFTNFTY